MVKARAKVKQSVKQTFLRRSEDAQNEPKNKWQRRDLENVNSFVVIK